MTPEFRDKLINWALAVLAGVLTALLTRWGVPVNVPPPPVAAATPVQVDVYAPDGAFGPPVVTSYRGEVRP